MEWVLLVIAGLFEIVWAIGLKYTDGFTRVLPSIGTGAAMVISVILLGDAQPPRWDGGILGLKLTHTA